MKKIALGMSGGIDSTMSALILQRRGYEVIGITMSIWDPTIEIKEANKSGCFGPGEADDLAAAKLACEKLGIEHRIIRLQEAYRENVLDYFCSTYLEGQTPNPCVRCNARMKFGFLPAQARAMGLDFDYFATGHYVRKSYDEESGLWQLKKAFDSFKDQSYFLCFLSQEQIAGSLFPLGEMKKEELRDFATQEGYEYLTTKKESQDFLETDDHSVLFKAEDIIPGEIVDLQGKVLGKHRGLIHYTIGQRKNIGIAGMPEPHYVVRIDAEANRVVVGPVQHLYSSSLVAGAMNWVSIAEPKNSFRATAKIRLAHEAAACAVEPMEDGSVKVLFDEPQLSITPGQIVVFYHDDLLLGGGVIRG